MGVAVGLTEEGAIEKASGIIGPCPLSLLIRSHKSAKVWQRRDAQGL